ncbi:MAG: MFS transporter [Eubacteriales bacterium]|nr:MFS transporter [Eubacteriales bacterium]
MEIFMENDAATRKINLSPGKLWQIGLFSLNNTSTNLFLAMMGYVSYYANGVAGLGVVLISFILTGMRIFDGITDPVIGYFIDKTNGRFGKFRPFIFFGYILMSVSALTLFLTTHYIPKGLRPLYFIIVYSVYIIGYTFQTAVVKSGQSVITNDPAQRPVITFFDSAFIMLAHGLVAFYVSVYLIGKYKTFTSRYLFTEFVITVIIAAGICSILAIIGIWEKDNVKYFKLNEGKGQSIHFKDYLDILKHNKPIKMLIVAAAANKFAAMVYGNATVIVMLYGILMNNYPLAGVIGIIIGLPNLGIIYAGIHYARRVGQKKAMVASTWLAVIFQTMLMIMLIFCDMTKVSLRSFNLTTMGFFVIFTLLNGVKSLTNNMVVPMIADCTDYEYTISGHFVPGIMGALFSFVDKSFSALGTGFVGIALSFIGYHRIFPQVEDTLTPRLKFMTIFFYCIIPICGWLITLFIMRFYKLGKKEMTCLYKTENGEGHDN